MQLSELTGSVPSSYFTEDMISSIDRELHLMLQQVPVWSHASIYQ